MIGCNEKNNSGIRRIEIDEERYNIFAKAAMGTIRDINVMCQVFEDGRLSIEDHSFFMVRKCRMYKGTGDCFIRGRSHFYGYAFGGDVRKSMSEREYLELFFSLEENRKRLVFVQKRLKRWRSARKIQRAWRAMYYMREKTIQRFKYEFEAKRRRLAILEDSLFRSAVGEQ